VFTRVANLNILKASLNDDGIVNPGGGAMLLSVLTIYLAVAQASEARMQEITKPSISSATAAKIVDAALAEAARRNASVCVVALDEAGRFLAGRCMDNVNNAAFDVAIGKARHSADFRRASKFQEDLLVNGNALQILAVPGMLPLEGGLPITRNDRFLGAVGVSGAASEVDGLIAAAGISAGLESDN
jgi:glc operon protein GlcG